MALNPILAQDIHSKQLIPHCQNGEYLLMCRNSTSFTLSLQGRSMKGAGDTFLTTHRIVMVKKQDQKFHKDFSSISLPYSHVDEPRFRQPIFGSNYLEGSIRPDSVAPYPLASAGKFYLYFDGGCGNFLNGFFMYYARVRNNPAYRVDAHPMRDMPESRSAFVDPNDPTRVYYAQPEQAPVAPPASAVYATQSGTEPSAPPMAPAAAAAAAAAARAGQADNPTEAGNTAEGETPAEGAAPDPAEENRRLVRRGKTSAATSFSNVSIFGEKCEGSSHSGGDSAAAEVGFTSCAYRDACLHLPALTPFSTIAFYAALVCLPMLPLLGEEASVSEHAYLHGFTPDTLTYASRLFMIETMSSITEACQQGSARSNEQTKGLPPFSRWTAEAPADAPAVYTAIEELVRATIPRAEVAYNDFRYVFNNGLGVTGSSILLHLKCARCSSYGASLVVATIDTGSKSDFMLDQRGYITRPKGGDGEALGRCASSTHGVAAAIAALKNVAEFDNQQQDLMVLITERNLPYAAGTRQFLDDYFTRPDFKWNSGWLHNALALDLGYGRCGSYEVTYEGLDGAVPNPDVVISFLSTAKTAELDAEPADVLARIGRMSMNALPHLPHVAMLPRGISSFTLTCARRADHTDENNAEKLLRVLTPTIRMQNNLDTVLERKSNYYQMVSQDEYLTEASYLPIVPALLLGLTVELLYSGHTWNFHALMAGLAVFAFNACMGPLLSYLYLVKIGGLDFDTLDASNLNKVRGSLVVLLSSYAALLFLNVLALRSLPRRAFVGYVADRAVLVRNELLSKLGYHVPPSSPFARVCNKIVGPLRAFLEKLKAAIHSILPPFIRKAMETARKRGPSRLSLMLERWRARRQGSRSPSSSIEMVPTPEEKPVVADAEETVPDETVVETPTVQEVADEEESQSLLDSMGGTAIACPTNSALPTPNVVAGIGTLFFATVFLYSLMIFHWPLAVLLSLCLVPALRRVRVWNHTRRKCLADLFICTNYLVFISILSSTRRVLNSKQRELLDVAFNTGPLGVLAFVLRAVYRVYLLVRRINFARLVAILRGPFVSQKVLSLAQQHVLLGSGALPLIWFCAVPVVFHIGLIFILTRCNRQ
ncbi:membrane protein, putative [Babesia bigemina]|uniref:Membrane protein, putative n=1 Tax=Babesia bigemina TaxID=5866 RepID=A0A061DD71_BABBI|nr:membrane protein, putative [Babesia bigemina]CDR96010.1 membrane protein, putative [Babesia bigemina]|eukprot:XP_012768196.1 membrane protein, putative [Babesia bigemina]